jgi:hypothetical protein
MARIAVAKAVRAGGLYQALAAQEEESLRARMGAPGLSRGRDEREYPRGRILDALRAGRTVNVPSGSLPDWARVGIPSRRGRLGLAVIHPQRAIVGPDDTVTWSDDDWARLWLEENDL